MNPPPNDDADRFVERLVKACEKAGLAVQILERSTRVRVNWPDAPDLLAEIITLKPDADETLRWWWSWGDPICRADDTDQAVNMIREVCGVAR